jgi:hypothetical protein
MYLISYHQLLNQYRIPRKYLHDVKHLIYPLHSSHILLPNNF